MANNNSNNSNNNNQHEITKYVLLDPIINSRKPRNVQNVINGITFNSISCKGTSTHENEDTSVIFNKESEYTCISVFDGHGSTIISKYLQDEFFEKFSEYLQNSENRDISKALIDTIGYFVDELKESHGGSTLSVVVIDHMKNMLHYANLGDSPIMCIDKDGNYTRLYHPHNVKYVYYGVNSRTCNNEMKDLHMQHYNTITNNGDNHENLQKIDSYMNLYASIGDKTVSKYLITEPYYGSIPLTDEIKFLLVASDGLTENINELEEIAEDVIDLDSRKKYSTVTEGLYEYYYGSDDFTCVLAKFN